MLLQLMHLLMIADHVAIIEIDIVNIIVLRRPQPNGLTQ